MGNTGLNSYIKIVLHGNAISTDGKTCSVFVGQSGAGKSTTAAWYFQRGAKILTDDVCAITFDDEGKPLVIPSFPQLKIWQESADLLSISTQGLRQIHLKENKFAIPTHTQFCEQPLPVREIFELQTAESRPITQGMEKLKCYITPECAHAPMPYHHAESKCTIVADVYLGLLY